MHHISSIHAHGRLGVLHLPDFAKLMKLEAKRDIEKGGTAYLLEKLFDRDVELLYTNEGKPYLKNKSCHISITHSHDKLAIVVNEKHPVGVDIELIRDKVLKIKHKFLSESEMNACGNDVQKLIAYWACKESMYKYYSKKEVDFIEHLFVYPITEIDKGLTVGEIKIGNFVKKLNLHYEKTGEYMLVYTLDEIE